MLAVEKCFLPHANYCRSGNQLKWQSARLACVRQRVRCLHSPLSCDFQRIFQLWTVIKKWPTVCWRTFSSLQITCAAGRLSPMECIIHYIRQCQLLYWNTFLQIVQCAVCKNSVFKSQNINICTSKRDLNFPLKVPVPATQNQSHKQCLLQRNAFYLRQLLAYRGISSNGRALAQHVRGSGIDACILQCLAIFKEFSSYGQ